MVRVNWTTQAVSDLKGIREYIAKDSVKYADLQVTRIRTKTQLLKTNPLAGRSVPEINAPRIREIFEGNYRIIYKVVTKDRVDILTIHHSARDLGRRKID